MYLHVVNVLLCPKVIFYIKLCKKICAILFSFKWEIHIKDRYMTLSFEIDAKSKLLST